MTTSTKSRRTGKPENNAEIRVRLNAKTKNKAEKLFKRYGLSTGDGMRRLIANAITDDDPWLAHKMSSHLPNTESLKAIEESLSGGGEVVTLADLRKQWDDA